MDEAIEGYSVVTSDGGTCLVCGEPIEEGGRWTASGPPTAIHIECQALGIVGHDYGVCSCTGYDTTARASALTLWERMRAAGVLYE
jgi:hypothetical protein